MAKKIFRSTMAVGLWVLLLSAALFLGMLYQYFTDRYTQELESETWLVARGVESMGLDYLDGLRTDNRITWVAQDGTVLYDNEADAASMENHADREEIQEALFGIQGTARRESATLSQLTIYVAHRLDDGSVIRLAGSQSTVVHLLMAMAPPIVLILIVTLIFAAALSSRLTKRLVRPILELDLERPEDSEVYDELSPLLTRIRRQNDTIRAQMDQLRQQKQEFTALTENMSEGFLLLDAKGRVLSYNTGVLRLLGAAAPAEEASVLTLDRSDVFQQLVEQVLDGRRSQVRMERAGRILQLLGDPVLRDGETAGAVLVLLDVTEREQAEQMRREFTANVSHELKTPLTSISGMAEIMKDGLVKQEDIRGFAADIYQESQRLIRLVEDILHLSRLDEGGGGLERQEIDLLDLARTVEDRLQSTAKQHQVELELTGDHAAVQGLPSVVEEMVYNLCDNAIKYNRPGGKASVRVEDGADAVTVTVSDTGIGIPPEDRERVFERFYRVDKSHSKAIGGTGLGLSIVKHGAALHNAQLELDSAPGKGTTVRLRFPKEQNA